MGSKGERIRERMLGREELEHVPQHDGHALLHHALPRGRALGHTMGASANTVVLSAFPMRCFTFSNYGRDRGQMKERKHKEGFKHGLPLLCLLPGTKRQLQSPQ